MHGLLDFYYYCYYLFFFHLKPFSFQHAEAENTSPAESRHLGKSLYARSSPLMLSLVSEIVLLWLQVTPQIAT